MPHFHKRIITPGYMTRYTVCYGRITEKEDPRLNAVPGAERIFFAFGEGDYPMTAFTFNREETNFEYFQGKFAALENQTTRRMGWLVLLHVAGYPLPAPEQLGEFQSWYQKLRQGWTDALPVLPRPGETEEQQTPVGAGRGEVAIREQLTLQREHHAELAEQLAEEEARRGSRFSSSQYEEAIDACISMGARIRALEWVLGEQEEML